MKDSPRPLPPRSAPYRKRKSAGNDSPARLTRRPNDASRQMVSPRTPDRPRGSHRDGAYHAQAPSAADGDRRTSSRTGGNPVDSRSITRKHTNSGGSARNWPHTSALSTRADVPGPSLRLPLTSVPPAITAPKLADPRKAKSRSPDPVTTFLRSIELPSKPAASAPPPQPSLPVTPPPPPPSTQTANAAACHTNGNSYQVSLVYNGYPFNYDLSALPDDPKGTIALLAITKSDPGQYLLVGAHYRRTGRSRAARAVIRSLLDTLDAPSVSVEKGDGDAAPKSAPNTPATPVSPPSCKPGDGTQPSGYRSAAMRPAMLLLAACEMDISRECSEDPESAGHASAAHGLFRAVYGTVNDAIIAEAVRPPDKKVPGLDFPSKNGHCPASDLADRPAAKHTSPRETASLARVKDLEKELSASRVAQKKLQEKLAASHERLTRAEDKVHNLESYSRDVHHRLDAKRDENWELRQRLAESEERAREMAQFVPRVEGPFLDALKDLFLGNLGGGMRCE